MKEYKIFVINPGSTSTKLSLFINEKNCFTIDVFHDSSILKQFPTINDQLDYRMQVVDQFIKEKNLDLTSLDAIAARGGASYSVTSGTYEVNDLLIQDTIEAKGGLYHSSMLGVQMAKRIQMKYGGKIYMSDPTVVDEYCDLARITGIDGIYRKAICHALNLKAVARKYAHDIHKNYEDLNLIVCHIDGGITITAHNHGKMIDGNDGGGGEGPFTPTRMGSMAISDVINYLWDKPKEEMKQLISVTGGLSNYFGTSNTNEIHKLVEKNDPKASRIWKAMIYQVCKSIGAMSCVLKGNVDGIVLTGGLMRFNDVYEQIQDQCGWIAPIQVYVGEYEQEALALNALKVLTGKEKAKVYQGKPVWNGFCDSRL
ncbi:MAG: butyrate kinase [Traorella sp.]